MSGAGAIPAAADLARLDALAAERALELRRDVPLAPLTTLRVGGAADRLAEARTGDELLALLRTARESSVPCFVLGNGSDLVVADARHPRPGHPQSRPRGVDLGRHAHRRGGQPDGDAGQALHGRCLAGLEFGISIPGTLGGAVWANAGAHGGEMRERRRVGRGLGSGQRQRHAPCGRRLRLRLPRVALQAFGEVVLEAALRLQPGNAQRIASLVAEHQAQRVATQPLADQNAGSVFRNPPGDHAGRLIDAAGLKGTRVGSAMVSQLHANFIVTDRGGRAADVRALGDQVRATVEERFGVQSGVRDRVRRRLGVRRPGIGWGDRMTGRLRIGIFAGGRSAEHEVSVSSAESVLRAIDRDRYEPYLIYIDRDGHWHLPAGPATELGDSGLAGLLGIDTPAEHTVPPA